MNHWAADHSDALAGAIPILALDMYEHSYHIDFGAAVTDYVDAFMGNIDWAPVYERYQLAVHGASEPFGAEQDQVAGALVLDVRRAGMFDQAESMIAGAAWRDPARVAQWARDLPAGREVVVYCVYGHEVGRATALRLRSQGVMARFLEAASTPGKPQSGLFSQRSRRSAIHGAFGRAPSLVRRTDSPPRIRPRSSGVVAGEVDAGHGTVDIDLRSKRPAASRVEGAGHRLVPAELAVIADIVEPQARTAARAVGPLGKSRGAVASDLSGEVLPAEESSPLDVIGCMFMLRNRVSRPGK